MESILKKIIITLIPKNKIGRPRKYQLSKLVNSLFYILRTGLSWRDLSAHFQIPKTTIIDFKNMVICKNILEQVNHIISKYKKKYPLVNTFIDSTMIKNMYGRDSLGRNHYDRFRNGNKITLIIDSYGYPLSFRIDPSNVNDIVAAKKHLVNIKIIGKRLIGDKGYISKKLKTKLINKGCQLVVPRKKNQINNLTKKEKNLLKKRNLVKYFYKIINIWIT